METLLLLGALVGSYMHTNHRIDNRYEEYKRDRYATVQRFEHNEADIETLGRGWEQHERMLNTPRPVPAKSTWRTSIAPTGTGGLDMQSR